jgi:NADPH:quinone reductase-like Zn-dependent oxidoreductase
LHQICAVVQSGHSVLVLGEGEVGKLVAGVVERFEGERTVAIARYKGSQKQFFKGLAQDLEIPTSEPKFDREGERAGNGS